MNCSTAQTIRAKGSLFGTQVLASLCCLLLLLPVLNVRLIVSGPNVQESEESRQPTEEERSSEDSIVTRSGHRRHIEQLTTATLTIGRGANSCRSPATYSPFAALARAEHELRNGVGVPLRC